MPLTREDRAIRVAVWRRILSHYPEARYSNNTRMAVHRALLAANK